DAPASAASLPKRHTMNGASILLTAALVVPISSCCKPTQKTQVQDAGVSTDFGADKMKRLRISIFELLAQPQQFSGEIVSVTGYLKMDVEEQLLYASEEFAKVGVLENAVALEATGCTNQNDQEALMKQLMEARDSYVNIRGRFMKADPGRYPF